jgi:hypothetical protein
MLQRLMMMKAEIATAINVALGGAELLDVVDLTEAQFAWVALAQGAVWGLVAAWYRTAR